MITIRDFLVRGLLAGLVGGVLAFGVAYFVGEPSVDASISIEEAGAAAEAPTADAASVATETHTHDDGAEHSHGESTAVHSHGGETEVPRSLQSTAGLLTGTALLGMALGGLVGVGAGVSIGRLGRLGVRGTAVAAAATGFLVLYAVPFLAYPPNPPAVGHADTIGYRTMLYFTMVGLSIAFAAIGLITWKRLEPRVGGWHAGLIAIGGYVVVAMVTIALMPSYNEVPDDFPAQVLFEFRQGSMLTQLALWSGIGVTLAELSHRLATSRSSATRPAEPEAASVPA
ncbi:MAG: CbtA family protein [Terracoccus sp.]